MQTAEPTPLKGTTIVVGLGNPGEKYRQSRHNVGFMVVDGLSRRYDADFGAKLALSLVARCEHEGARVWLVKPQCYMNRSGRAVFEALAHQGDEGGRFLVVYDDFHLPVGKLRFRARGSAGGHNGIKSIVDWLGSEDFPRLRIGIGCPEPDEDPAAYVLAPIPQSDEEPIREALERAAEGVEFWIHGRNIEECMNRYN